MKNAKRLVELNIVGKWRVPSKSEKGEYHLVLKFKNGEYMCDCMGYSMRGRCKHIEKVEEYEH